MQLSLLSDKDLSPIALVIDPTLGLSYVATCPFTWYHPHINIYLHFSILSDDHPLDAVTCPWIIITQLLTPITLVFITF